MSDADIFASTPGSATPEKLSAWQRWELPAFEAGSALARNVGLPTASQLEKMQQLARDEAYQAGYTEGQQRGYAEGLQQALAEKERLAELTKLLESQIDEKVTQELMGLSLDIAQQVLQQSLKVQPELLLIMVREAIGSLPVFNQAAHLILNPEDAAMVREHMGEQLNHSGWKILEDPRMARGDARLETANSQVDATLEARWNRVVTAMGQEAQWLVKP
ncbi:MAG: flagellar assembly protein FliH [Gallionellaceae bacterium]|nr:MAG: flagellar assembly protein FliH [Gallionellaceae bacterium]